MDSIFNSAFREKERIRFDFSGFSRKIFSPLVMKYEMRCVYHLRLCLSVSGKNKGGALSRRFRCEINLSIRVWRELLHPIRRGSSWNDGGGNTTDDV